MLQKTVTHKSSLFTEEGCHFLIWLVTGETGSSPDILGLCVVYHMLLDSQEANVYEKSRRPSRGFQKTPVCVVCLCS